jgi:hypothetical protein
LTPASGLAGPRQDIWFRNVLYRPDQLRQRMAFALSQIFVVSDQNGALEGNPTALAHYHDQLSRRLRQLSHAAGAGHPASGDGPLPVDVQEPQAGRALNIRPDENYAREIMQLFSIGLVELNPMAAVIDGDPATPGVQPSRPTARTPSAASPTCSPAGTGRPATRRSPNGRQLQLVGLGVLRLRPGEQDWRLHPGWRTPMFPWGEGTVRRDLPRRPGQQAAARLPRACRCRRRAAGRRAARANLQAALDNVFRHPNVGPFLGRLLIQRLTTSNPSPAYVGRVAAVFANNGQRRARRSAARGARDPARPRGAQPGASAGARRQAARAAAARHPAVARARRPLQLDGASDGWPE